MLAERDVGRLQTVKATARGSMIQELATAFVYLPLYILALQIFLSAK